MRELARRIRDLVVAGDQYRHALATTLGVGVPEAMTLGHLYHDGYLTPTAIAERLGVTTASVTGLLDRLAAAGYVARSPNPRDRRSILVRLTESGGRVIEASFGLFTADIETAMSGTEAAERAALEQLLQRATTVLREAADTNRLTEMLAASRESTEAPETPGHQESSTPSPPPHS